MSKSKLTTVFLAVAFASALAVYRYRMASTPTTPTEAASVDLTVDFGVQELYAVIEHVFKFGNSSDSTLTITDIKTNCACIATKPNCPIALEPGEYLDIPVKLHLKKLGDFSDQVYILVKEHKQPFVMTAKGTVISKAHKVDGGGKQTVVAKLNRVVPGESRYVFLEVPPGLEPDSYTLNGENKISGEKLCKLNDVYYRARYRISKDHPFGSFKYVHQVVFSDGKILDVVILVEVSPSIIVWPKYIESKEATIYYLRLTSRNKRYFEIVGVEHPDGVTVKALSTSPKKNEYRLQIAFPTDQEVPSGQSIQITTSLPNGRVKVPIK